MEFQDRSSSSMYFDDCIKSASLANISLLIGAFPISKLLRKHL